MLATARHDAAAGAPSQTVIAGYMRTISGKAGAHRQIVPFKSTGMERLYLYGKILLTRLPRTESDYIPDLFDAAVLTHLRIEKGDVTSVSLTKVTDEESEIGGHTGEGRGKLHEQPTERLSSIIEVLNNRFGCNLTEADQLFFEQVEVEVGKNKRAQAIALHNDIDQFMTVFGDLLEGIIIDRHTTNDALLTAFLDKPDFRESVTRLIGTEFYNKDAVCLLPRR